MIGQLFFTADGGGKHPGPTYFRDFAPIPFGKLMVLLITSIWNVCLFHFIAWLHPHGKKYFPGPDKRFIEKWLLERKFARNPLKTPVKEQQQKLLYIIYYPSHEIFRYQKLLHAFQTLRTIPIEVPFLFTSPTPGTKLITLYWSHLFSILIVRQFIINLRIPVHPS